EHITETTERLADEGRLSFEEEPDMDEVTWHDPCHIGRHAGIYEPPRNVLEELPGVELKEMEHNRENSLCCGSVLTRVGEPDPTSDNIAAG
ncbi:MAG: heterodisulfide reductase-related iron-sulfur binding cluster, partial [Candidatus Aenigmatarchaeota archaeon]